MHGAARLLQDWNETLITESEPSAGARLTVDGLEEVELCTEVARALHENGTSALRLERSLEILSTALGVGGQFFATPTAVLASYSLPGKVRSHTRLLRMSPGAVDLGRLADVEALLDDVVGARLAASPARGRLRALLEDADRRHRPWRPAAGAVAVSAAAAVFLGGGWAEVVLAGLLGATLGVLELLSSRVGAARRLVAPAMAMLAALATLAAGGLVPTLSVATAQLASLIVLVPGLDFTLAVKEVATANLVSGAARLVSALGDFMALGFGVALGTRAAELLFAPVPQLDPVGLSSWALPAALLLAALGFAGRLRARSRDLPWVILACALGFSSAAAGTALLGGPLGAFVGAAAVGLTSNLVARLRRCSPLVMLVPGILLLVPGSFGFRSFELLLRHDVVTAIEAAFTMILTATALSMGLLLANVLLPSDKEVSE